MAHFLHVAHFQQHKVCSRVGATGCGSSTATIPSMSSPSWLLSAKDVMHQLLHGEHVMLRAHPEGECLGCLTGDPKN